MTELSDFTPVAGSEEFPEAYLPLEDRILPLVHEVPFWNFKYIKDKIPQEHDKNIYRALRKLESQGKIKFVGYQGRSKVYTTKGVSKLPVFVSETNGARLTMSDYAKMIPHFYRNEAWIKLEDANEFPVAVAQLFIAAQRDEPLELYSQVLAQLVTMKTSLSRILEWIETLLKHPITNGDMKLFKQLLNGNDAPTPDELNQIKLFISKHQKAQNEASNQSPADSSGS